MNPIHIKKRNFISSSDYWGFLVMLLSFFVAIVLSTLSLPLWMQSVWPLWVVLVLIFWSVYLPHVVSPWVIWFLGLLSDVIHGSLLGEHALSYILIYFFAYSMNRQIKSFPLWEQMLRIVMIILLYQGCIMMIQGVSLNHIWLFMLPVLTSLILWPWILFLMRSIVIRFYIHQM